MKAWQERPLGAEYYAVFLNGTFLSIRRGKTAKELVYMALGIKPDGRREILGFWLFGVEGESARNWEEVLKDLKRRGGQRVRIFSTDQGWRRRSRRSFRRRTGNLKIYRAESREEAEEALRNL